MFFEYTLQYQYLNIIEGQAICLKLLKKEKDFKMLVSPSFKIRGPVPRGGVTFLQVFQTLRKANESIAIYCVLM